ncbi:hypothetical protein BC938DRAFT_471632, partial [Jimgerdemannia flammicorona]
FVLPVSNQTRNAKYAVLSLTTLSDVDSPGPGFEYFLSTPCENWNLPEYFEAWTANYGLDKANLVRRFNTQLKMIREHGTDEEKRNAMRLALQFKTDSKKLGCIDRFWFEKMTENHIGVLEAEQKLAVKQEFTQQIKMYAKSATRSTMQILDQNSRPSTPLQTTNTSHEAHTSPGSMDSLSILSTSTRSKRKMANLPKYDQNIKIRLLECQSSESDYEENDYLADSSDDEENCVAQDADCFLDPFADNNEEGGWMLDDGSSY